MPDTRTFMASGFQAEELQAPRQAIARYLARAGLAPFAIEQVPLDEAYGRVLADEIRADDDYPSYPRSTMDGFALNTRHGTKPRRVAPGAVLMGRPPIGHMSVAEAIRIPTGGLLPGNADAVVPQEDANFRDGMIEPGYTVSPGEYITRRGSDLAKGDLALEAGRRLGPAELGVLAALGVAIVPCYKRPNFAVISTGDELVAAEETPLAGGVRDSNRHAIAGALRSMGCAAAGIGPIRDDLAAIREALRSALVDFDGVIISGGSSVGDHDMVPQAVGALGAPGVIVHGLRVRPGKPTMLAAIEGKPVIGLPGNPASALMMLEAVVRSAIVACTGERAPAPPGVLAFAREPFAGREGWTWFMPVHLELAGGRLLASPLKLHSAHVSLLSRAHGYVVVGEVPSRIEAGEPVRVEMFSSAGPPIGEG
jgi:molybdenum cofactor synthesis domain-containing protein